MKVDLGVYTPAEARVQIPKTGKSDSRGFFSPGLHTTGHADPYQAVTKE